MRKSALAAIICLALACEESKKESIYMNDTYTFEIKKGIEIKLDSVTSSYNQGISYVPDAASNNGQIIILNKNINSLQFYSSSGKLKRKVKFEIQGSNGVGKIGSFLYCNNDSIFVIQNGTYNIYLVDIFGIIKRKYTMNRDSNGFTGLPIGETGHPMVKIGNKLYVAVTPDMNPAQNIFYEEGKVLSRIDLITGNCEYFINYPESYLENNYPVQFLSAYHTINTAENELIFSFAADDNIQKYSLSDLNNAKSFICKSKFFNKVESMKKRDYMNSKKNFSHYVENGSYEKVLYDSYNKLYYRFVQLPDPAKKDLGLAPIKFNIIIMNNKYEKIGEFELPKNILNGFSFITKQGLNIEEISSSEDKLIFALLILNKK